MTPVPPITKCRSCSRPIDQTAIANMCNDCRILSNADAMRLCIDPESPNNTVWREPIVQRLIAQMTGEEFIAWRTQIEGIYLDLCRVQQQHGITSSKRRVAKSLEDSIREAEDAGDPIQRQLRNIDPLHKAVDKRAKRKKSLGDLLGVDSKTAEEWMNEDLGL